MGFTDWLKNTVRGYDESTERLFAQAEIALGTTDTKALRKAVTAGNATIKPATIKIPGKTVTYPVTTGTGSKKRNEALQEWGYREAFIPYSVSAVHEISKAIAPEMLGLEDVKTAAALQLFADERLHILLLGDPGTGKTEVLRSSHDLAIASSMGLGSGTSRAGLSVAYFKGELYKGLLVQANNGICCIDELNLMKKDDRAALYNAMEKGFVTYDKAGHHETFDADVRVLATANPKGDRFTGTEVDTLKKQLPFDPALLSRFHFVFLIRQPDTEGFAKIAKSIARKQKKTVPNNDFIQHYIRFAHKHIKNVEFPENLEPRVTEAATKIKDREEELLIEVSPRIVKGIIGFAKASARAELRDTVRPEDIERVLELLGNSLGLRL